jgi:hypothetical protein
MNNSKNIQKGGFIHAHDFLKKIISIGFEFETQSTTYPLVYDDDLKTYRQFHSKDNVLNFNCEVKQEQLEKIASSSAAAADSAAAAADSAAAAPEQFNNIFELQLTQDTPEIEIYYQPENIKIENLLKIEKIMTEPSSKKPKIEVQGFPPSESEGEPTSFLHKDEPKTVTIRKNLVANLEFIITFKDIEPSNNIIKDKFKIACKSIYTFMENMTEYQYELGYCLFSNEKVLSQHENIEHEKYIILSAMQKNQITFYPQCTIKINYDDIIGFFVYFSLDIDYYIPILEIIINHTNNILDLIDNQPVISGLSVIQYHKLKTWIFLYMYYLISYSKFVEYNGTYFKNSLPFAVRHTHQEIFPNFGPQNQSIINVLKEAFNKEKQDAYFDKLFGDQPTNTKDQYDFGNGILIKNEITFFPYDDEKIFLELRRFNENINGNSASYINLENYNDFTKKNIDLTEFNLFISNFYSRRRIPNFDYIPDANYNDSFIQGEKLKIIINLITESGNNEVINDESPIENILRYLFWYFDSEFNISFSEFFDPIKKARYDKITNLDLIKIKYSPEESLFFKHFVNIRDYNKFLIKYFHPYDVFGLVLIQIMKIIIHIFDGMNLLDIYLNYCKNSLANKTVADLLMQLYRAMGLLYHAILEQNQITSLSVILSVIWWLNKNFPDFIDRIKQHKQQLLAAPFVEASAAVATSGGYLNNWFHHCY